MAIYLYAPVAFVGTEELIAELGARRLRKHDGMRFISKGAPIEFGYKDIVVCWGAHVPTIDGVRVLNNSYRYSTQLSLNIGTTRLFAQAGLNHLTTVRMSGPAYEKSILELKEHGKPTGPSKHIAYKEFPGYGVPYVKHFVSSKQVVHAFRGVNLETGKELPEPTNRILQKLELDFARITFSDAGGISYMRKILTAPPLRTAKLVKAYASAITGMIEPKVNNDPNTIEVNKNADQDILWR